MAGVFACALPGCGGGGGSSGVPAGSGGGSNNGSTTSGSSTIGVGAAATAPQSLPSAGGITGTIALPNVRAPSGATLSAQSSTSAPSNVPTLQSRLRVAQALGVQAYFYVAITPNQTLTLPNYPNFTFSFPAGTTPSGASLYLAFYDGGNWNAPVLGPSSNGTFTGASKTATLTLNAGTTYVFAVYVYTTGSPPGTSASC